MNTAMILVELVVGGIGLTTILIGVVVLLAEARKPKQHWVTTEGRIYASRVVEQRDEDGETSYYPEVLCTYLVDGGKSCTVSPVKMFKAWTRRSSQAIVRRYPAGRMLQVRYDPDHPRRAVIDEETS